MRAVILAAIVVAVCSQGVLADDVAVGDPVKGAEKAKVCKACHQWGETAHNAIGPVLNGVVGRKAGTYPDYNYSDANKNSGLTWDVATLTEYLKDPRAKVPGTKMTFAGFSKQSDIDNVVVFLKTLGADGKPR